MIVLRPRLLNELDPSPGSNAFGDLAKLSGPPDVWLARLTENGEESRRLDSLLTDDERIRRNRFRQPADQQRFAQGRAWLRVLLGTYHGIAPHEIELQLGTHGKPYVLLCAHAPGMHFNIAHSGDLIMLAFHPTCEVGIDVERVTVEQDWGDVARQLFSPQRFDAWAGLDAKQRHHTFFQEWTRREAGLKAIGSRFAVEQPDGWDSALSFFELELPADYKGSVAISRLE